jgi:serine/threonine protein kinase
MSLQEDIAHYRIVAKLGEGGMGVVWRATDTKLNREVAIKVLPDAFARDPERLARFQREAQLLASLNHPNIAAIYGVEDRALIMELVDGPALAERIAEGPGHCRRRWRLHGKSAMPWRRPMNRASSIATLSLPTSS